MAIKLIADPHGRFEDLTREIHGDDVLIVLGDVLDLIDWADISGILSDVLGKDKVPPEIKPQVGQRLQLNRKDGQAVEVLVTNVTDADITLDANHPLAGKDLTFDIELVEVS